MKFLSSILSLLLLVLSCLPCADADLVVNSSNNDKMLAENHVDHSNEMHFDLCSPFCICNCCGIQILNFTPTLNFSLTSLSPNFNTKMEISYKSHSVSAFSGSIWQPPQIA